MVALDSIAKWASLQPFCPLTTWGSAEGIQTSLLHLLVLLMIGHTHLYACTQRWKRQLHTVSSVHLVKLNSAWMSHISYFSKQHQWNITDSFSGQTWTSQTVHQSPIEFNGSWMKSDFSLLSAAFRGSEMHLLRPVFRCWCSRECKNKYCRICVSAVTHKIFRCSLQ